MAYDAYHLSPARVLRRLLFEGKLYFAMGRFRTVRRGYSLFRAAQQWMARTSVEPGSTAAHDTIFPGHGRTVVLETLRRDGIYLGLQIPPAMVSEIVAFASTSPLTRWAANESFTYAEVKDGRLPDGRPVVVGSLREPEACPAIARIARDPELRGIVSAYLGYVPQDVRVVMFWNFASNLTAEERRQVHQANNYHYDVDGYNFLYVQFFMTDVDSDSGQHVIIKGSHRQKPMRMLFSSVKKTDAEIWAHYGMEREFVVEGKAGFGFVEDTSSFHKAMAPRSRDRLLLQFVYS